jgi:hypothetical protein
LILEGAFDKREDRKRALGRPVEGFVIDLIALTMQATVPGLDDTKFREIANAAKRNCPLSKALASIPEITLKATLRQGRRASIVVPLDGVISPDVKEGASSGAPDRRVYGKARRGRIARLRAGNCVCGTKEAREKWAWLNVESAGSRCWP